MRIASKIGTAVALLAASIAIVSYLGAAFEPADFLNQLAPVWIVGGTVAALVAICARPARAAVPASALLILIAVAVPIVLPDVRNMMRSGGGGGTELRLVQFNLWKDNPDPAAAAAWLKTQDADVIVLQETIGRAPDIPRLLRGMFPFQQPCVDQGPCSTVLLARRPPAASGGLARADPENRQGLSAAWMRFSSPCGPFTIVGIHLSRPWPWHGSARDRTELLSFLARQATARVIVAGDFNLAPATFAIRRFDTAAGIVRLTGTRPTWPSNARVGGVRVPALLALDQVHAGGDWTLASLRRGPPSGSDHFPIVATLRDVGCAR